RFRTINARAQHVQILLRAFAAFPQVADLRAGAGNNLQQVVQFTGRFRDRFLRNGLARGARRLAFGVHAAFCSIRDAFSNRNYKVTKGKITMDGEDLLALEPDDRARKGLFLAFQYPSEIPGVTIANFLRAALAARLPEGEELEATDYYAKLYEKMELLGMDRSFTSRAVNEGFSGGEKKRAEILQLAMLEPKYAVLDETDSGLDIDALKTVAHGVN